MLIAGLMKFVSMSMQPNANLEEAVVEYFPLLWVRFVVLSFASVRDMISSPLRCLLPSIAGLMKSASTRMQHYANLKDVVP